MVIHTDALDDTGMMVADLCIMLFHLVKLAFHLVNDGELLKQRTRKKWLTKKMGFPVINARNVIPSRSPEPESKTQNFF